MITEFELNHLKYFYYTVLEGGVGPAANKLCVQQPVVSKMLKTLEDNFNQPLFWKSGRKKSLTDFGQLVFRHCQVVFEEVNKISQLPKGASEISGALNIGGAEPIINYLLPKTLEQLKTEFPKYNFNIYSSTMVQLLDMLTEGRLDFVSLFYAPQLHDNLEVIHRQPFRFHLVVKKGLEKNKDVLESFIGSREVDDTSTHSFPTLDLHRKKYPKARITTSCNSISLHKDLVLRGQGISVMPEFLIKKELASGRLIDLMPKKKLIWDLMLIKKKSTSPSQVSEKLISLISS